MGEHRAQWPSLLGERSNVGIRRWWERRCPVRATLTTYTIVRCELRLDHHGDHAVFRGWDAITWRDDDP